MKKRVLLAAIYFLLWASLASADCVCWYVSGHLTEVCSSSTDIAAHCAMTDNDYREQLEHNRREWRKLMSIQPGDEDFYERMGDYLDDEDQ